MTRSPQDEPAHDVDCAPALAPSHIVVLAPYIEVDGRLESPHYDLPEYRAEIDGWIATLADRWRQRMTWEWAPVTTRNLAETLARVATQAREGAVAFNLCDGTQVDGYPGVEVVEGLEALGVPYTGSDAAFYRITTSKAASKRRLLAADVSTAPFVLASDFGAGLDATLREAERHVGYPMFVKPDVSAGSYGIQVDSVCRDEAAVRRKIAQLRHGLHGQHFEHGGVMLESFIEGREFTALVVEDERAPLGLWTLPPCERVFDPRVPRAERFLAFERYWGLPEAERPIPPGDPYYWYSLAPPDRREEIADLARRAMRAVGGVGYARVDIRLDEASGRLYVLEVNAQCGLSSDDSSTVGSMLRLSGASMADIIERVLRHARRRTARAPQNVLAT